MSPPGGVAAAVTKAEAPVVSSIETDIVAYRLLGKLATHIGETMMGPVPEGEVLIVQDSEGLAALVFYRLFLARMTLLTEAFESIQPAAPPTTERAGGRESLIAGAAAAVGAASGVIGKVLAGAVAAKDAPAALGAFFGLVRPTMQSADQPLTIADESLAADVAGYLARRRRKVLYPRLVPIEIADAYTDLHDISEALARVWDAQGEAIKRLRDAGSPPESAERVRLTAVSTLATQLDAELVARPADGGESPLATLSRGASRHRLLGDKGHLLFVKMIRGGGTRRETSRTASLRAPRVEFSGGVIASYFLFDSAGVLVTSGTEYRYSIAAEMAGD